MNFQTTEIETKVNDLLKESENEFTPQILTALRKIADDYLKEIETTLSTLSQEEKINKARLLYLKGSLLDILPDYSKQAEESLSKALKLNPLDCDCWNTLGHILWKKKDYLGSKKCFECSLEQQPKNKIALRSLSIVLRSLGKDEERKENVKKSIEYAKSAVNIDIKDPESWYILGNAYMSNFFVNMKYMAELQNALKAYNQAEAKISKSHPDLHYNRANILAYLEDYETAILEYRKANEEDPLLNAHENIQKIRALVTKTSKYIDSKGNAKPKKILNIVKTIPSSLKSQPKDLTNDVTYEIIGIAGLKNGLNKGKIFSGKVLTSMSDKGAVPAIFVCVDFKGDFCSLSVFNTSNEVYEKIHELSEVFVIDPLIKEINLKAEEDVNYKYQTLQIYEIDNLYVDSAQITQTFSPNIVVNETFQH